MFKILNNSCLFYITAQLKSYTTMFRTLNNNSHISSHQLFKALFSQYMYTIWLSTEEQNNNTFTQLCKTFANYLFQHVFNI